VKGVIYQQPVSQAQDGLYALVRYKSGQGADYLVRAEKEAKRLIATHTTNPATGKAWWYPYRFTINEYGTTQVARPPWYSGMAQGTALHLFTELYTLTHDSIWETAARETFTSFLYTYQRASAPWTLHVNNGYLWIEEYPTPNPNDHTINGFGFALWGLITYARAFNDPNSIKIAQAGLTTFLYATGLARHVGGSSSYSLSHPAYRPSGYHLIVTQQLRLFGAVTGDSHFTAMAQTYARDYSG
jgi:hypothetical protein